MEVDTSGSTSTSESRSSTSEEDDGTEVVKEPKPESMKQWCRVATREQAEGIMDMENGWFTVKNLAEKNDGVYLEVVPTRRYVLEEMVESPDEVSLNRHVRKRLRKSMNQVTEAFAVDVARVTTVAKNAWAVNWSFGRQDHGLRPGV